jgi:flagellar assembly protein FliH
VTNSSSNPPPNPKPASPYARFIPREELGSFAAWAPDSLHADAPDAPAAAPAAADLAALQAQLAAARQAGYQDGYRDGLAALESFKSSFARQMTAQIGRLVESFGAELAALEPPMAQAIGEAALALARGVVRAELQARPRLVAEAAQQALAAVLLSARHICVRVHPDDLPLVETGAGEALAARDARLVADAEIERGGCRIESDLGRIDATLETRWRQAAALLGSERPWVDAGDEGRGG